MAQQLSPEELASFKELLMSGMIEIQTIAQLLHVVEDAFRNGMDSRREGR